MARKPVFAGKFYESNEVALDKQIADCFSDKNGPGDLPLTKRTKQIQAIIAPHDIYARSGPCAAWAYKEIAEAEFPDLFIVIGPNHHNGINSVSLEGYETPFGLARVDKEFATALLDKNAELAADEKTHEGEYSIEVQIPFLQFATKDKMHEVKIVPIIIADIDYAKLALDIKETLLEQGKKAILIVSTDFTHYGREHKYVPFSENPKEKIYALDRGAIDTIEKLDPEAFLKYTDENLMNICGIFPIATLLKALKTSKVSLEQYYTTADLEENSQYKNAVSYAAIIFN
jgi:AmmeMemoRadiSam system protein B